MRYKNQVTGAVFDSPCRVSGGDWIEISEQVDAQEQEQVQDEVQDEQLPDQAVETETAVASDLSGVSLAELSVKDLKALAAERRITLGGATKKADIIEMLLAD